MEQNTLYSRNDITRTYEQVHDLLLTRYIIKTYSSNRRDIRDVALSNLNCINAKKVLELGCGYGFFIEKLKGRIHDSAVIIGIDMVENNREPFLHSVSSIQYTGEFISASADIIKEMPQGSFDMIITSYSLYFFPHLIPDIARVLAPGGVFIAVTHSKNTLKEAIQFIRSCMKSVGSLDEKETVINRLFSAFSLEEGRYQLEKHFKKVERLDYSNSMVFPAEHVNDFIFYMQKKKNLIYKEVMEVMPEKLDAIVSCVEQHIIDYTAEHRTIILNKDDAVFRCFEPKY
ncbi:MAG TPA: class I SAM-dependent methyltransferase [Spirochaetota bacterium]|nr:class I SAM-dependent methyltransferase [Spirochaetota bacterium]HPC39466.1 class I SAM-dependent methyltransferase [Spirochaetota bacterium]HPL15870.1 class I SAM-dependent methyltransferase [Spirochaetota bacterium]HQF06803.1 class I SAM-dependent methyltransferase [Spirochaetota bacterium]HQH95578.1 class I SAM-dependent methyltransferase [Spirochaetota bacterium]